LPVHGLLSGGPLTVGLRSAIATLFASAAARKDRERSQDSDDRERSCVPHNRTVPAEGRGEREEERGPKVPVPPASSAATIRVEPTKA